MKPLRKAKQLRIASWCAVLTLLGFASANCDPPPESPVPTATQSPEPTKQPSQDETSSPEGFKTVEECDQRYGEPWSVESATTQFHPLPPATEERHYAKNGYGLEIGFIDGIAHHIRVYKTGGEDDLDSDEIHAFLESNKGNSTWDYESATGNYRRSDRRAFAHYTDRLPSGRESFAEHAVRTNTWGLTIESKRWKDGETAWYKEQTRKENEEKKKRLEGM